MANILFSFKLSKVGASAVKNISAQYSRLIKAKR